MQSLVKVAGADCPLGHLSNKHPELAVQIPPSTVSKASYLRAIKALKRWAIEKGWMGKDVTQGVDVDPGPVQMRPYLQPEEVDAFLSACTTGHRIRAGLIVETGLRPGEAVNLRWSWIQEGVGRPSIRIPALDRETGWKSKGKRVRAIPLSLQGQEFLKQAANQWGSEGFVLHDLPRPPLTSNWRSATHRACVKAGVTLTDTHGLRRTAGVLWFAAGMDIYTVSRLLGHASVTTTEKSYVGIADCHLSSAFDAVDQRASLPKLHSAATTAATRGDKKGGEEV